MDRRVFIKNTLAVSAFSSLLLSGSLAGCFRRQSSGSQKALVLIQLEGGNDGLNTVIPIDQYKNLIEARKNILIPEKKILRLNDTDIVGFHPSMPEIQKLYNNNCVSIIQSVGYDNPDLSHFRAIDNWYSASPTETISTGWLGRFLDLDQYNVGGSSQADPPAIEMGGSLKNIFQGRHRNMGMALRNIDCTYDFPIYDYSPSASTRRGDQLSFLQELETESQKYLLRVKEAGQAQNTLSKLYPPQNQNKLADQLRIVARLIGGGLQTKVYFVNLTGFDTHSRQVDSSDPTQGDHAGLLSYLSEAIGAFQDDLHLMGREDNVLSMTFSEFGRRIKSNASFGSDHGTSAPVLLFGSKLKNRLIGKNPEIPAQASVNDNIPFQTDFRSVYGTILKRWFDMPDDQLSSTLFGRFPQLDIFKS